MRYSHALCTGPLLLTAFTGRAQKPLKKDEALLFAHFKGNGEAICLTTRTSAALIKTRASFIW